MFHSPQYVPRSLVANHDVMIFAHAGPPQPCRMPLRPHSTQNHGSVEPRPNMMLTTAWRWRRW